MIFYFLIRSCLSILCQFINLKEKIIPIHQFQFKNWKNKIQFYCFIDKLYFVPLPQWVQQDRSSRFWVVLPRSPHRKYLWIVLANLLGAIFLHQPIFLCKNTKLQFVKLFKCSSRHNTNYVLHAKENFLQIFEAYKNLVFIKVFHFDYSSRQMTVSSNANP